MPRHRRGVRADRSVRCVSPRARARGDARRGAPGSRCCTAVAGVSQCSLHVGNDLTQRQIVSGRPGEVVRGVREEFGWSHTWRLCCADARGIGRLGELLVLLRPDFSDQRSREYAPRCGGRPRDACAARDANAAVVHPIFERTCPRLQRGPAMPRSWMKQRAASLALGSHNPWARRCRLSAVQDPATDALRRTGISRTSTSSIHGGQRVASRGRPRAAGRAACRACSRAARSPHRAARFTRRARHRNTAAADR